jgi:hypothetical protein
LAPCFTRLAAGPFFALLRDVPSRDDAADPVSDPAPDVRAREAFLADGGPAGGAGASADGTVAVGAESAVAGRFALRAEGFFGMRRS